MSVFLLIHGAWHGAWCWEKIIPSLEAAGHRAITIDLPGHGEDQTPISEITLDAYANRIVAVIDELEQEVILVGHSMGGVAVSQAAEYRPKRIKSLVYISAFLFKNGQNMIDVIPPHPDVQISEDGSTITVAADKVKDMLYNNCKDEDVAKALAQWRVQAMSPLLTPVHLTERNFGQVPRYYIECLRDHSISIETQRQMHAASPCKEVFSLDTDHTPLFSNPAELSSILLNQI
ncbi:pimeloyl-ACP methyl ester carboxylesterase [Paenibacillus rhizosphaerae]|uniref:Pimeloyl-ACP methyl ester carboxylesterase n=1 Tax=Paenibacillus rhizosphaerae TaxID=297318 RepID=A0A839TSN7_9BACL|nr:alpha/beta fold hydrolase [Paenibacillus rhizosphaerae]MBB3128309.1 pimeloyl-ACP methyl ester carboxylesterase [Paenibacillus rhizosphaerae]